MRQPFLIRKPDSQPPAIEARPIAIPASAGQSASSRVTLKVAGGPPFHGRVISKNPACVPNRKVLLIEIAPERGPIDYAASGVPAFLAVGEASDTFCAAGYSGNGVGPGDEALVDHVDRGLHRSVELRVLALVAHGVPSRASTC